MIAVGVIVPAAAPSQCSRPASSRGRLERHAMASPHSAQDVALVALGVVVVMVTTTYTVLYLIRPGETDPDHVKRRILEDDAGNLDDGRASNETALPCRATGSTSSSTAPASRC